MVAAFPSGQAPVSPASVAHTPWATVTAQRPSASSSSSAPARWTSACSATAGAPPTSIGGPFSAAPPPPSPAPRYELRSSSCRPPADR
ncbi:pollen-specific leucine-rich repeat extensin-like protein 4 [Iris pallida]|uniref:Pollen-specific leucine-rich repeat extensin-like protein 4 n=1 Tax=Iris pallida TaxID=29817 RepID=A0AAX6G2U7_IRIPA|nr:pollen-specific leucine-rich repeat extensin-like protein 4 [Iris pallida]